MIKKKKDPPVSDFIEWTVEAPRNNPITYTVTNGDEGGVRTEQWGTITFLWSVRNVRELRDYLNECLKQHGQDP